GLGRQRLRPTQIHIDAPVDCFLEHDVDAIAIADPLVHVGSGDLEIAAEPRAIDGYGVELSTTQQPTHARATTDFAIAEGQTQGRLRDRERLFDVRASEVRVHPIEAQLRFAGPEATLDLAPRLPIRDELGDPTFGGRRALPQLATHGRQQPQIE